MSNAVVIALVLVAASLTGHVSAQMDMSPSSGPSGAPDCMTNLMNMTGCLSYVMAGEGGGAAKPDKTCCPALAGLVESSPQCLCYLLSGDMAAQLGVQIDKAKALKLPGVCGVVTPDPSLCSLFGVPVGAPVAMGNEGASPTFAPGPMSGSTGSPGGLAPGPAFRTSDAPSIATYSLFLNLVIFPLAFVFHTYC
ncbi:PREDICTED: non-specific lipid transfer protein GPI-anchored 2-like [Camelina sativa]|uniref:Non-specific lipid transfer protein GPI-anchored 2-like n=1 Tax=Camelina sativa TaxID=90675 RepID=A0ABM0TFY2_CAMSA|nr:PREDICTED: non-specific lipid transfer protein GPI-anchored 2-like [Camelina sativa]